MLNRKFILYFVIPMGILLVMYGVAAVIYILDGGTFPVLVFLGIQGGLR